MTTTTLTKKPKRPSVTKRGQTVDVSRIQHKYAANCAQQYLVANGWNITDDFDQPDWTDPVLSRALAAAGPAYRDEQCDFGLDILVGRLLKAGWVIGSGAGYTQLDEALDMYRKWIKC